MAELSQHNTEEALSRFAVNVIKAARSNLTRKDKNVSSALYKSFEKKVHVGPNSFELEIAYAFYGDFQDKGVQGFTDNRRAPDSPFKMGSGKSSGGGKLYPAIFKWVKDRGIQFNDRSTGRFMTHEQTAHLVAASVWHKGIKATRFITNPFNKAFQRLPGQLVEAFALDVEGFLEDTLNNNIQP